MTYEDVRNSQARRFKYIDALERLEALVLRAWARSHASDEAWDAYSQAWARHARLLARYERELGVERYEYHR